jgi:hypothetical protein
MNWVSAKGGFDLTWYEAEYIYDEHGFALARVAYEGYLSGLDRKPVWMAYVKVDDQWFGIERETTDKDQAKRFAESRLANMPPRQLSMF